MRLVLLANTDWYLANFRFDLACALRGQGAEVHCIAPPGKYLEWLGEQGFVTHALKMGDGSFSPLDNWRTYRHLVELYREIRPELAHHFTPRCVVLGSLAARKVGVGAVVNALTGLGHVFTSDSAKARLARPVLRGVLGKCLGGGSVLGKEKKVAAYAPPTEETIAAEAAPTGFSEHHLNRGLRRSYRSITIFQNLDDLEELVGAGVVDRDSCRLIRGSGVDTEKFRPADPSSSRNSRSEYPSSSSRNSRSEYPGTIATDAAPAAGEVRVFFASRLILEKGVDELVAAMQVVRETHANAVLWVAGEPYAQNPTSLTAEDVRRLEDLPWVKLFGHVDDVERLLAQVDIVALPSYREGTPKILLEAAACGLPIVATDIAGCRGVVEEGVNGFLVPVKDSKVLAERLGLLCGDAELRRAMGAKGRRIVVEGFSSEIVVRETLKVYGEVLGSAVGAA